MQKESIKVNLKLSFVNAWRRTSVKSKSLKPLENCTLGMFFFSINI